MAKILNGILGGGSGKVGGVIMSSWKGINTLKAYAIPANPNTSGQQTQRGKFAAILAFLRLILTTVIQPYWDPFAVGQSGFNQAMSVNLLAWADDTAFDDAIVAQGNLEGADISIGTYASGTGAVVVAWDETIMGNGALTDNAVVVMVDTGNNIAFVDTSATRDDEGITPNIGADRTVGDLKFYLFFHRGTGEDLMVSPSDYHQAVAP